MLFDLRKEQRHWIAQGQYWLAEDARIARQALEQSDAKPDDVHRNRAAGHLVVAHGKRLAKLNGNSHLTVPWQGQAAAGLRLRLSATGQ